MSPTTTVASPATGSRMSAEDRRALVLAAATRAFSRGGFHGTSTDAIAKEAGVSQPYVVRLFGTKRALFVEVLERTCTRIRMAFEAVLAEGDFDPDDEEHWTRLGLSYTQMLADRHLLMVLMHGFAASDDDEIAACARAGMGRIVATILSTGCTIERATEFVATGMLMNVMVSMRALEHLDDDNPLAALTIAACGDSLDLLT